MIKRETFLCDFIAEITNTISGNIKDIRSRLLPSYPFHLLSRFVYLMCQFLHTERESPELLPGRLPVIAKRTRKHSLQSGITTYLRSKIETIPVVPRVQQILPSYKTTAPRKLHRNKMIQLHLRHSLRLSSPTVNYSVVIVTVKVFISLHIDRYQSQWQ